MSDKQLDELKKLHNTIKAQFETQNTEIVELKNLFKEILKWTKFSNIGKVKETLEMVLDSPDKKIVYHLSDGEKTRKKIKELTSVPETTVSAWWRSWYKLGIADPIPVQRGNRGKKIFDLKDYDIRVPKKITQSTRIEKVVEEED